jgi:S-layer homology domain
MNRKISVFAIGVLAALALPLTVIAQNATDSHGVVSNAGPFTTKAAPTPSTFGTLQTSYLRVPSSAFLPYDNVSTKYTSDFYGAGPRWITSGLQDMNAPLALPSGSQIVYLELDFTDSSTIATTYGSLLVCDYHALACVFHPVAGAGPGDCLVGGFVCSGYASNSGASDVTADLTPDNLTVNNYMNSYSLLAEPSATDGSEKVGGMIVGYVLQVHPPPATATFLDVPLSSPYNQFVEAFVQSGLTAGCGGGNYCPNSPVTRGQVAVFLSKALGLQWTNY